MYEFDPFCVVALRGNPHIPSVQKERPRPEPPNPLAKRDRDIIKTNAEAVRKTKLTKSQKINKDLLNEMNTDNLRTDINYISNETLLAKQSKANLSKGTGTRDASTGITNLHVQRDTGAAFANETVSNKLRRST